MLFVVVVVAAAAAATDVAVVVVVFRVMSMMGLVREQLQHLWCGHLVQCFFSPVLNLTPAQALPSAKSESSQYTYRNCPIVDFVNNLNPFPGEFFLKISQHCL